MASEVADRQQEESSFEFSLQPDVVFEEHVFAQMRHRLFALIRYQALAGKEPYRIEVDNEDVQAAQEWVPEILSSREKVMNIFEEVQGQPVEALKGAWDYAIATAFKNTEVLEKDDPMIFAVSRFISERMGFWFRNGGEKAAARKLAKGGEHHLRDLKKRDGVPTCLDLAVAAQQLLKGFGIQGEIKRFDSFKAFHYFWQQTKRTSPRVIAPWDLHYAGGMTDDAEGYLKKIRKSAHT